MNKLSTFKRELTRIAKYQVSGLAVIGVDWTVYFTLNELFGGFTDKSNFTYYVQPVSYTCAAVVSYAINRKWTFGSEHKFLSRKMLYYLALNLVSLAVSLGVLALAREYLSLSGTEWKEFLAKVIVDTTTAVLNYAGIRFWIFRDSPDRQRERKP